MDVRLSGEQVALRDAAARLVDDLGPRSVAERADAERIAKLDGAVTAAGWRELRTDTETGAPWASAVDAAIIAEELGRGVADTAFLGPTLAAELRRMGGAAPSVDAQAVVLTPDLRGLAATVAGRVVDGALAIDAAGCASALVLVPEADGHGLGEVRIHATDTAVDLTRSTARVGPAVVARLPGTLTDEQVTRWTAFGLALACADLVGTMRGAITLTCDYAAARHQYGVPVGSFQAVQHLLADALVAMEGSRSVTLYAAWGADELPAPAALAAASVAKAYCTRAARTVGETAILVHGGIGNTWECMAHLYLRRALLSSDVLGGVGESLARVLADRGIGGSDGLR